MCVCVFGVCLSRCVQGEGAAIRFRVPPLTLARDQETQGAFFFCIQVKRRYFDPNLAIVAGLRYFFEV